MNRLVIDIGNSSTKIGIFYKQNIICTEKFLLGNESQIVEVLKNHTIEDTIISSTVKDYDKKIEKIIFPYTKKIFYLNQKLKLPFENLYQTPETLGSDRIAAVAGAQYLFPGKNILVIDAGTAITYDLLVNDKYIGGNIAPGLNMRLKSLNYFTNNLPLVEVKNKILFPGKNTTEAISAGVITGILFEIEGYRNFCKKKIGKILTIFTGGDTNYFVKQIKKTIFANSNLVLIGLNKILEFNNEDIRNK